MPAVAAARVAAAWARVVSGVALAAVVVRVAVKVGAVATSVEATAAAVSVMAKVVSRNTRDTLHSWGCKRTSPSRTSEGWHSRVGKRHHRKQALHILHSRRSPNCSDNVPPRWNRQWRIARGRWDAAESVVATAAAVGVAAVKAGEGAARAAAD